MSRGYSRVILVGNIGRDPEMRYTPSGTAVTSFTMAVNRRRRGQDGNYQDETDWYRINVWGRQAETADQYLRKGSKVLVDGSLQIRTYTGNDGTERTSVEVNADNFQMLDSRGDNMGEGGPPQVGGQQQERSQPPRQQPSRRPAEQNDDPYADEDLDDVPF
jgi:single-strand DNA-binding protein